MTKCVERVLLTNDDGIDAKGLQVLRGIAQEIANAIWIVAPTTEQSGASHSLSLQKPLQLQKLDERCYTVNGTPTDCVLLAIRELLPNHLPDLILSGVNAGQNLAEDIGYSGTVAGAMEGAVCGLKAIAFSQGYDFDKNDGQFSYDNPQRFGAEIIRKLMTQNWPVDTLFNVNFPPQLIADPPRYAWTRQGKRDMRHLQIRKLKPPQHDADKHKEHFQYYFERAPNNPHPSTDLAAFYRGEISITPLHTNITNHAIRAELSKAFGQDD